MEAEVIMSVSHPSPRARRKIGTRNADEELSPLVVWGGGSALVVLVAGLFWGVTKSQFAAPPGYLFGTRSLAIEAGYCLSVAQGIVIGGAPIGSYFDEAAQFWIKRLRDLGEGMAPAIAAGQAKLSSDQMMAGPKSNVWYQYAMDQCSNRALAYGAHFRSFD